MKCAQCAGEGAPEFAVPFVPAARVLWEGAGQVAWTGRGCPYRGSAVVAWCGNISAGGTRPLFTLVHFCPHPAWVKCVGRPQKSRESVMTLVLQVLDTNSCGLARRC